MFSVLAVRNQQALTDLFLRDAEDTQFVYAWRLEQEAALREKRGSGMTDEEVRQFVDGCE